MHVGTSQPIENTLMGNRGGRHCTESIRGITGKLTERVNGLFSRSLQKFQLSNVGDCDAQVFLELQALIPP